MNQIKSQKVQNIENKVKDYFEDSYFDVIGMTPGKAAFTETQLVKLVTKITVGMVTVWWSSLELKTLLKSIKSTRS